MKNNNLIRIIVLISGIIIAFTGILHCAATPMMHKQLLSDPLFKGNSGEEKLRGMVYFFMVTGLLFIFSGLLMVFSTKGLKRNERWAWHISIASGVIILLISLAALLYAGFDNPLIYLDVLFSSIAIIVIIVKKVR